MKHLHILLTTLFIITTIVQADCPSPNEIIDIPDTKTGNSIVFTAISHNQQPDKKINFDFSLFDRYNKQVGDTIMIQLEEGQTTATSYFDVTNQYIDGDYKFNVKETVLSSTTTSNSLEFTSECTQETSKIFNIESDRKTYSDLDMKFEIENPYELKRVEQKFSHCNNGVCPSIFVNASIPSGMNIKFDGLNISYKASNPDWETILFQQKQPMYSHAYMLDMYSQNRNLTFNFNNLWDSYSNLNKTITELNDFCTTVKNANSEMRNKTNILETQIQSCRISLDNSRKESDEKHGNSSLVISALVGGVIIFVLNIYLAMTKNPVED